ncbi:carbohydrate ABC transporter substrate-binding protein (CUT1 family) [Azoarcus indigens]|uniref:sn-glycerol-3-phosphate-binding periplasmic protein UgpB n=2 Tax=Azoarcus indigens TaxID=29545 RepID=A0A4R6DSI6_9RHOO|nr:carbohydrate ABC transporter substrate-binding protein (CUT1 family) [Azoarcus indigens]
MLTRVRNTMNSKGFKRGALSVAMAGLFALAAPLHAAAPASKAPAKPAAKATEPVQLEIVHQLPPARAAALKELVERFNASSKDAKVEIVSRDWRVGTIPDLLILDGAEEDAFVAGKPRYKPLHAMMREAGVPLQALRPPAMMTRTPVDTKGQLLALPVGLSTPVLFLNKDAFRRAGMNPDATPIATWFDLQQALGRLADAGQSCPYTVAEPGRVMVENLSAWHNEPVAAVRGKALAPSFNGMFQVKHVAMMASWHRASYLRIFDRGEAERRFAAGDCAVIAASSADWTDFRRQQTVDVGVSRLPYYDDFPGAPQNTLADGPALWAAAGKKPATYKAAARFVSFWLQPENQVAWQRETGYLPLNRAGLLASQSDLLGDDLENVRVAVAQLTNKPVTSDSSSQPVVERERVRRILDEELAFVWADRKPAKEALDTAVLRAGAN